MVATYQQRQQPANRYQHTSLPQTINYARPRQQYKTTSTSTNSTTQERRQSHTQHVHTIISLNTQNVRGMKEGTRDAWLKYFRQKQNGVQPTFTIIQETHTTGEDIAERQAAHALGWGFRPDPNEPLSFWSAGLRTTAGVAILINPHAGVTNAQPRRQEDWTPRFIAITCMIRHTKWLIVNVYGPNDKEDQAIFYGELASWDKPDMAMMVGGDFNSCVHDLDRSYGLDHAHRCWAMEDWLESWDLGDSLNEELLDECAPRDRREYAVKNHTFHYGNTSQRSARVIPGTPSDHRGVIVQVQDPTHRSTAPTTRQILARASYVRDLQNAAATELLLQLTPDFLATQEPADIIAAWERLKTSVRKLCCRVASQARRKQRKSYRLRLKQLQRQIQRHLHQHCDDGEQRHGVDDITQRMQRLTLNNPMDMLRRLEARVTALKHSRAQHMARRQQGRYRGRNHQTTKNFFARYSVKYSAPRTADLAGVDIDEVANVVEADWQPIMEGKPTCAEQRAAFLGSCRPAMSLTEAQAATLLAPITLAEVIKSFKRCRRGKACGPDGLANDFYRDQESVIAPMLQHLFNACLTAQQTPITFRQADIFCLAKTKTPLSGLDFRPLALLNTDYKLFTRILSFRVRPLLTTLVHRQQSGFVPHRSIHDTIATLLSFQDLRSDDTASDAAVLLLDFRKAYDTLDRSYLVETLAWMGFPQQFVAVIDSLHSHTTARFQVNGVRSTGLQVTSGIRQGCPLASLLFVMALEPLYQRVTQQESFRGIQLPGTAPGQPAVKIAGYADDTALYTYDARDRMIASSILADFERAAGLGVNPAKTVLLPTSTRHTLEPTAYHVPENQELVRYLGVPVSVATSAHTIWAHVKTQIRTRLVLAIKKTTNVRQRARLASTIAVPKITFIAQHVWPSKAQAQDLQRFLTAFVWNATFDCAEKSRAWLHADRATQPRNRGGLNVPNVAHELIALAAATVARQGSVPPSLRTPHSRQLTLTKITQPQRTNDPAQVKGTLWTTGIAAIGALHHVPRPEAELTLVTAAANALDKLGPRSMGWRDEEYHVQAGPAYRPLMALLRHQTLLHGTSVVDWLPSCDVTSHGFIVHANGKPMRKADVNKLGSSTIIKDMVNWRWIKHGHVAFKPVGARYPTVNDVAEQFRNLVILLLANYPKLLHPRRPHGQLLLSKHGNATYTINADRDGCTLSYHEPPAASEAVAVITHEGQVRPAIAKKDKDLQHARHPLLSQHAQLFLNVSRVTPTYKHMRQYLKAAVSQDHPTLFETVTWQDINAHAIATDGEIQTFTRLKLNRMNYRKSGVAHPMCPHEHCGGVRADTQHVMWDCVIAQAAWNVVWLRWEHAMAWKSRIDMFQAIYQWQPTRYPAGWGRAVRTALPSTTTARLRWILIQAWTAEVLAVFHLIYVIRLEALQGQATSTHATHTRCGIRLRALQWHTQDTIHGIAFRKLYEHVQQDATPTLRLPGGQPWLLFFDGGARGNPGPGGAGAVIVRLTSIGPELCWVGSTYHTSPATNNQAEFAALRDGLAEVRSRRLQHVHVIGDSLMIIAMMASLRSPLASHLQVLHDDILELLDAIPAVKWYHHVRNFNKMADAAANWAMDTRTTTTTTHGTTPLHRKIAGFLYNDVTHWVERTECEQRPKSLRLLRNPP